MRVMLINTNREISPWPVIPLGLSYVASSIKQQGHDVQVVDLAFSREPAIQLKKSLLTTKPDAIGVTIRNIDNVNLCQPHFYLEEIRNTVISVCRKYSEAWLIIGGSAIGIAPLEIMDYLQIDYAATGDGEQAMIDWLHYLEAGATPSPSGHLFYYRDSAGTVIPPGNPRFCPLKEIPHPRPYTWIDYKTYEKKGASANIQSKRGCVFNCIYCSYNLIEGKHYRLREPGDVVDEIEGWIGAVKPREFEFVDSTFNSPQSHSIEICEEIIRRNLNERFTTMGLNPGCISTDLLQAITAAGFHQSMCSPDSASDQMLHNLDKNFQVAELIEAVRLFKKYELRTFWFFILGGPGETRETVQETLDFCKRSIDPRDVIHTTIGFRVFSDTVLAGRHLLDYPETNGKGFFYPVFYCSPHISPAEILRMVHQQAARNCNIITYFDMEIYDTLKDFFQWMLPSNPPEHNWQHVPQINRNLRRAFIWPLLHYRHRHRFQQLLRQNKPDLTICFRNEKDQVGK